MFVCQLNLGFRHSTLVKLPLQIGFRLCLDICSCIQCRMQECQSNRFRIFRYQNQGRNRYNQNSCQHICQSQCQMALRILHHKLLYFCNYICKHLPFLKRIDCSTTLFLSMYLVHEIKQQVNTETLNRGFLKKISLLVLKDCILVISSNIM